MRLVMCTVMTVAACGDNLRVADAPMAADARADVIQLTGEIAVVESEVDGTDQTVVDVELESRDSILSSRDEGPCHIQLQTTLRLDVVSGGAVTIAGSASGNLVLAPNLENMYPEIVVQRPLFAPNDAVSISGAGATVPAFAGMVTFPSSLAVLEPTSPSALSKSGFSSTWNPTGGSVHIEISQTPDNAHDISIDCAFPGADGAGTIPSVALTDLVAGTPATLTIATEATTTAMAGDYIVTLFGSVSGIQGDVDVQ